MPKVSEMITSKYLKKDDVGDGVTYTIRAFKKENVARDDQPAEHKWVMYFDGEERGLVLNRINLERAAKVFKSTDTDDWVGKQIVAYCDESIEFGGRLVGGIRLRAPQPSAGAAKARAQLAQAEEPSDDIPF